MKKNANKSGLRSRSRLKKKQEPEPLKNKPAPRSCWTIKRIRKLYFSYSSLGKIASFYD